jgi:uncharacterized protein (TIGR03437 family)
LSNPNPAPGSTNQISVDQISDAFSGDASAVVGGGLYSIAFTGFQAPVVNLGINPSGNLSGRLGGVQVTFDGVAAAILAVAPGQIIVAPPDTLGLARRGSPDEKSNAAVFTSVQL